MTRQITFDRMKKNPSNVTMFGASHNGRSCTKPFHYIFQQSPSLQLEIPRAYVVFQDIIRYQGLVDTRIFIGFQMNQGLFGHALVRSLLYKPTELIEFPSILGRYVLLLGAIGVFGVVTGGGSKAPCGSVFTANRFRGRMVGETVGIALPTLARLDK
jgi:hypothetical protein